MTALTHNDLRPFARTLAVLRLCAVGGQISAVAVAVEILHLTLPVLPLLTGVAALGALCLASIWRLSRPLAFAPAELVLWFALDIADLTYMLYLTGGASNPLVTLLIMPIALAATALPMRQVIGVVVLAGAAYVLLILRNLPLPILHAHDPDSEFSAHLLGMAVTFAICGGLLALFITRLARDARANAAAVQRERERALRDEGLLAIALQAAGAAHALNTPLSTLATLVAELRREHAAHDALPADLELLASQVSRCRDILRELVAAGTGHLHDVAREHAVEALVETCADQLRLLRPSVALQLDLSAARGATIRASMDLEHSLLNLLNNACDASQAAGSQTVLFGARRAGANVLFEVRDFGPGLPSDSAGIGLRFFSSKRDGLGLGVALASATAERYRGSLIVEAAHGGGARTTLSVPLAGAGAATDGAHV